MADVVSGVFPTTLLVLYFVTPAATVDLTGIDKAKFEQTKLWTLQSTSQIMTENPDMCVANGKLLIDTFANVSTVSVRAYCLCPQNVRKKDVCDKARAAMQTLAVKGIKPPPAAIIPIGPNTPMPNLSEGPPTQ